MDNHNEKKCLESLEGINDDGKRTIRKREADFYGMIMGVRSWSHSLKAMKLKLEAITDRMRCVVFRFRFPFKHFFLRTFLSRFVCVVNSSRDYLRAISKRLMSVSPKCLRVMTLIITNPIETEDLMLRWLSVCERIND